MQQFEQLALEGGPAVFPDGPPAWPPSDGEIREALQRAFDDGSWGRYEGPHGRALEQALRQWLAVDHVMLAASGTMAVEMALRGLGLSAGDEVLLAAYDYSGNFRCVEALGAIPVLVDLRPGSWCPDTELLAAAISPATRAVLVSHLHGCLAPMRAIVELARQHGLLVIEDACQVPGATVDGRLAGTWGDVGVFSFGGSKLLTAGRGGAIVTSQPAIHQRAKIYYDRGNQLAPLSELQAAVLLPQLARLGERNARRAANVARLLELSADLSILRPAPPAEVGDRPSYYKVPWRFVVSAGSRVDRQWLIAAARAEGLALDAGFRGFFRRGPRRCRTAGDLRQARHAAETTVVLHHPVLLESAERMAAVARVFEKISHSIQARVSHA
ncbi:MAG: aminotransferase class V-fold PLP-dependent enzyme [Pirellulaceae bacterium]|nr:aminotransferase class V-fold PLP-dependent enzyme [Pirellulaceae bacterium]